MDSVNQYSLRNLLYIFSFFTVILLKSTYSSAASTGYLEANQTDDGFITQDDASVLPVQSTLESLITFRLLGEQNSDVNLAALAAIPVPDDETSTEIMAHWVIINQLHSEFSAVLAKLVSRQNLDGGFGHFADFSSDPLNTAIALQALYESGYASDIAGKAVQYLSSAQNTSGSWNLIDKESDLATVELTAIATHTLWKYRKQYLLKGSIDAGVSYLLSRRDGELWSSTEASALALYALINQMVDRSPVLQAYDEFLSLLGSDDSFDGDVNTTAIGLRVLNALKQDPEDISLVRGRIVDAEFGAPIANASIVVSGTDAETLHSNSDGQFTTAHLSPGVYDVEISQDGFSRIAYKATISEGTKADLGEVKLSKVETDPVTGEPIVTGFVRGVVKDEVSDLPIANALVTLNEDVSTVTNHHGEYLLTGVLPGNITIQVTADGYQAVAAASEIVEQQTLLFSPLMRELPDPEIVLSGSVVAVDTLSPLQGVTVRATSGGTEFTAVTDLSGFYTLGGLPRGAYSISAELDGYQTAQAASNFEAGMKVDFSPRLSLTGEDEGQSFAAFTGKVIDSSTGFPIDGVEVSVEANAALIDVLLTNEFGVFDLTIDDPSDSDITLRISYPEYLGRTLEIELINGVKIDLQSILLVPQSLEKTAFFSGAVYDGRTSEAVEGATISIASNEGDIADEYFTNIEGRFSSDLLESGDYIISISSPGYYVQSYKVSVESGQSYYLNDIFLQPSDLASFLPDAMITELDTSLLAYDQNDFSISGDLRVRVNNVGDANLPALVDVIAFSDVNRNGQYDETDIKLGSEQASFDVENNVDQENEIAITLGGQLDFFEAPISVYVDQKGIIPEKSKKNNLRLTSQECSLNTSLEAGELDPVVKWHWTGPSTEPGASYVYGPVAVAQMTDDNQDGVIDRLDKPDIIVLSNQTTSSSVLSVLNGEDSSEIWSLRGTPLSSYGSVSVADIDGDGVVEILGISWSGRSLLAYEHTGELKWQTSTSDVGSSPRSALTIADINNDGSPEIVHGNRVYSSSGELMWVGSHDRGNNGNYPGTLPIAADINLDGTLEVLAGRSAYSATGELLWHQSDIAGDGFNAVGNFDNDDYPEIVLVTNGSVYLLDQDGSLLWGPVSVPGGGGVGAPTVADLDGDGQPEIGVAGARRYVVIETDGSIKWESVTIDDSSNRTGSSVFDFESDGRVEVLYADERFFRIYDGSTGEKLYEIANLSGTTFEYPVVADIDGDSHAEVLVGISGGGTRGLRAFESRNDLWANTRRIWNQHSYHIDNIDEDGKVPQFEEPSWLSHNTYRLNTFSESEIRATYDLSVGGAKLLDSPQAQGSLSLSVIVGNSGGLDITNAIEIDVLGVHADGSTVELGSRLYSNGLLKERFTRIEISSISASLVQGVEKIEIRVQLENGITECNLLNNTQIIEAASLLGDVELSISESQLSPNTLANLSGSVTNTGSLIGNYQLKLSIEDASNNLVYPFDETTVSDLASGVSIDYTEAWNTGLTLAGEYRAVARLYSTAGLLLDEAVQGFSIGDENLASRLGLNAYTDKPIYNVNDRVILEMIVQNLSLVTEVSGAELHAQVLNPEGLVVFDEILNPASMAPGQVLRFEDNLILSQAVVGDYNFNVVLKNAEGETVVMATSAFEVFDDPRAALSGAVNAEHTHIDAGDPQVCSYSLSNRGLNDLASVPWSRVLVKVDDQLELEREGSVDDLLSNDELTANQGIMTGGLAPGGYACVLEALIEGEAVVIASATFVVGEQDIQVSGVVLPTNTPRVLAWVDGFGGDDPGVVSNPNLNEQLVTLENALGDLSVAYKVVSTAAEFEAQMFAGEYNYFAVLAEGVSLSDNAVTYLSNRVYLGDTLLVTSAAIANTITLQELAGVQVANEEIAPLQLSASGAALNTGLLNIDLNDVFSALHLNEGSVEASFILEQPWQSYQDSSCVVSTGVPAITSNGNGAGSVVVGGFDWLLHAANEQLWEGLFVGALNISLPALKPVIVGDSMDVFIQLSSPTGANGKIIFTLPEGIVLGATDNWAQENSVVTLEYAIGAGELVDVALPLTITGLAAEAMTGTVVVGEQIQQQLDVHLVTVLPKTHVDLSSEINNLVTTHPRDPWIKLAQHSVNKATGSAAEDLNELLKAQAWLKRSLNDVTQAQQTLAQLIARQVESSVAN